VLVWLMFSWLAQMGSNPQQLVHDLQRLNAASWQKALTLADLLRNPEYDELKRDPDLAGELSGVLTDQLEAGATSGEAVKLRMFLCRALGEFHVADVVAPLLRAAEQEESPEDIDVRRSALEALAVFASQGGAELIRSDPRAMDVLRTASRERSERAVDQDQRAELRSAAAYALGIVGGSDAMDRLEVLTKDAHVNTRYNAALGLARHGDLRSESVLLEMLNPKNPSAAEGESHAAGQASKRLLVIKNGIRGVSQLAQQHSAKDLSLLAEALRAICASDLAEFHPRVRQGIRIQAETALIALNERP
jgi:hypothetical protein